MKGGTLFSGGGGFCIGMIAAGVSHAWGIEYDDKIAQVARDNGLNTVTADILQCDPKDFEPVDLLHASPPCSNFSTAKKDAKETENDRLLAVKVCGFIIEHMPHIFTLENVYGYRKSKSWQRIARTLLTHGYQVNYWHVNMADYGVPQTRKRMIVIARRDGITPMLPPATHAETPVNGFFERRDRWVSWYEAIEDLIPTLPESKFAPWQLERLNDDPRTCFIQGANSKSNGKIINEINEPARTVDTSTRPLIFIMNSGNSNGSGNKPYMIDTPMPTITAGITEKEGSPKIWNNGIVLRSDINCAARWQSFPDWYVNKTARIIGNAVPSLFAQKLVESITK